MTPRERKYHYRKRQLKRIVWVMTPNLIKDFKTISIDFTGPQAPEYTFQLSKNQ